MTTCWKALFRTAFVLLVLLVILLAAECFRLFSLLSRIHPVVGLAFLGAIGFGLLWLILSGLLARGQLRTSHPPELPPNLREADYRTLRRFCRYLATQADGLSFNPNLNDESQDRAMETTREIKDALRAHPLLDDLRRIIERMQFETLPALTESLNQMAIQKIRETVESASWACALGTLTGNCRRFLFTECMSLGSDLADIYGYRSALLPCAAVFRDTCSAIRSPRLSQLSHEWVQQALAHLPDDIKSCGHWTTGLDAGLFVRLYGALTMRRATGLPAWNQYSEIEFLEAEWVMLSGEVEAWIGRKDERPSTPLVPRPAPLSEPDKTKVPSSPALSNPPSRPAAPFVSPIYTTPHPTTSGMGQPSVVTAQNNNAPMHSNSNDRVHRSRRRRRYEQKGMFRVLRTFIQRIRYTMLGFRS